MLRTGNILWLTILRELTVCEDVCKGASTEVQDSRPTVIHECNGD